MNFKILIIGLVALCCLQLALARDEDEPELRRNRPRGPTGPTGPTEPRGPRRLNRSPTSSKSLKRSTTRKLTGSNADSSNANIAEEILTQPANRSVLIEGKDGGIFVDKKKKYRFRDEVEIKIQDGNFYVNDNLVLKKPLSTNGFVVYSTLNFNYQGISSFTLEINPEGFLHYKDSTGEDFTDNYFTRMFR